MDVSLAERFLLGNFRLSKAANVKTDLPHPSRTERSRMQTTGLKQREWSVTVGWSWRVLTISLAAAMLVGCGPASAPPAAPLADAAPAKETSTADAVSAFEAGNAHPAVVPEKATSGDDLMVGAIEYTCVSGARVFARYDEAEDVIHLQYGETRVVMSPAISASGARFASGEWVWWGKGSEATLFTLLPDGETGGVIERCSELTDAADAVDS